MNVDIAKIFNAIADILEIKNVNKFRVIAYRRAAQNLESLPKDVSELYHADEDALDKIPGIGESLAEKIKEYIKTQSIKEYEQLKKSIPEGVAELMELEGVGPKKAALFYKKFKVKNIKDLRALIQSKKLRDTEGFGEKTEENLKSAITHFHEYQKRIPLGAIYPFAKSWLEQLRKSAHISNAEICGSFRRRKETIGDLDFLITARDAEKGIEDFLKIVPVKIIKGRGATKVNGVLENNLSFDLRVIESNSFGAALHYFTGSKAHNVKIRTIAQERGLKISEYGVFKIRGKKEIRIGGKIEKKIFSAIGLPYIPPELREDTGEVESGFKKKLPLILELSDVRGDLQMHTTWSDGTNSMEEMARAAQRIGYHYICFTDHSPTLGITGGLTPDRLKKYIFAIEKLNKKNLGIHIFKGMEVDIRQNGTLDTSDDLLKLLDIVLISVHTAFKMPKDAMTARIIKALKNPYAKILAHPTGRLINRREPYAVDMGAVLRAAKEMNKILEINASWQRLDLNDIYARQAKEIGCTLSLGSDAHSVEQLSTMQFGVFTARRGWIESKNIVNTLPLEQFKTKMRIKR